MSRRRVKVKDFTDEVALRIPEFLAPVKANPAALKDALNNLLALEKKTRLAADIKSTTDLAVAIITICRDVGDWKQLNEQITALCKKRAQLQTVQQRVIQEGFSFISSTPDKPTKLELINTLRAISAGKMFVELERARMTKILSDMKEAEGATAEAADVLSEVQVETIGSMEIREKADFLLEQVRLCLAKKDYVRAEIVANKVNTKTLNDEKLQDLKLKYHRLLIEYHSHFNNYFLICKSYREIFNTPVIKADAKEWKQALTKAVQFLVLSPFDSEVSDILHRLKEEKKVSELPSIQAVLTHFTTDELMRWPFPVFEDEWKADSDFDTKAASSKDRYDDLHKRVVQHNIRVISMYYERITSRRLAELLGLDADKTETYLSEMVSSKQLFAKIDRPTGIIVFARKKDANDMINAWASDIDELLSVVEKTTHMINKENMIYKIGSVDSKTEES